MQYMTTCHQISTELQEMIESTSIFPTHVHMHPTPGTPFITCGYAAITDLAASCTEQGL